MPDMDGSLILRSDSWHGRKQPSFRLNAFTSVTTDINGTFAKESGDALIRIKGLPGQVKDLSEISLPVHFGRSVRNPDGILPELLYMKNE